jgi:DivIVA domain-containing protein
MWWIALLAVVVIGFVWLAAQGRLGAMPPLVVDQPGMDIPEGEISSQSVRDVRFAVEVRGYSMTQVDTFLARLAEQLAVQQNDTPEVLSGDSSYISPKAQSDPLGWPEQNSLRTS